MEQPEEQQWEQEQEEEEEVALLSRSPRNQSQEITTNGNCITNGGTVNSNGSSHVVERQVEEELRASKNGIIEDEQQKSEYSVYYDSDKGLWKCRICSWDYESGTGFTYQIQNPKRHWHMLINIKTVDQQGPCFIHETEGIGFHYKSVGEKNSVEWSTPSKDTGENNVDVKRQNLDIGTGLSSVINNQNEKHPKHESFCDASLHPSEISIEGLEESSTSYSDRAIESADIGLRKENDLEATELDVETILKKQETHDLYCPNCNSCITKRVILRKRKRRIRTSDDDAKHNKVENLIHSELDVISVDATNDQAHDGLDICLDDNLPPALNDYGRQREPDIFRCLSCFSIFIPTGNGFKLFQFFGDKTEKETKQDSQNIAPSKKSWFSSIFAASDKAEVLTEQGTGHTENNIVGAHILSSNMDEPKGQASPRQESNSLATGHGADMERHNAGVHISASNLNESKGQASSNQESLSTVVGLRNSRTSESLEGRDNILPSSTKGPALIGKPIADVGEKLEDTIEKSKGGAALDHSEVDTGNHFNSSIFSNKMLLNGANDHPETTVGKPPFSNGELAENRIALSQQDGLKLLVPSNVGSSIVENSQMDQKLNVTIQKKIPDLDERETALLLSTPVSVFGEPNMGGQMNNSENIPSGSGYYVGAALLAKTETETDRSKDRVSEVSQHHNVQNKVEIHIAEALKVDKDAPTSCVQDALLLQDRQLNISKNLKPQLTVSAGEGTTITIETGQLEAVAPQRSQDILDLSGTGALQHIQSGTSAVEEKGETAREVRTLDVIKSIVYGGLIESITSLGVVSSAVGADAATLNVLSLGLANLFGGLFVISHDLWDLKNERTREAASDQGAEQPDRYQELLGRRADFLLHVIVALFSYLIFGLLPPVVYGFSFCKSDDGDLKLVVVAAASMICITILAAGKAYVQRPPKSYFKILVYYVAMGLMVSGASYTIGSLLKRFLEQIGIFPSSSVVTLSLPGARSIKPVWDTY